MAKANLSTKDDNLNRRKFGKLCTALIGTVALGVASQAKGGEVSPDAELISLGLEYDKRVAAWKPLQKEFRRMQDLANRAWDAKNIKFTGAAYEVHMAETGLDVAVDANGAALDRVDELGVRILEMQATTLAGFAAKVKVLRCICFSSVDFDVPREEMNWDHASFDSFAEQIEAAAADPAVAEHLKALGRVRER